MNKKKYRSDMPMKYSSSGDAGCVKQFSEQSMPMLNNGGDKYSHNNPKELKEAADKLAKQV